MVLYSSLFAFRLQDSAMSKLGATIFCFTSVDRIAKVHFHLLFYLTVVEL